MKMLFKWQTSLNCSISFVLSVYFSVTEWILLRVNRVRFQKSFTLDVSENELISVIIPTYNREEMLRTRSLPSALAQTHSNIEVVVVSHGSTDGTDEYVAKLNSVDNRVRLIKCPRHKLGYPPVAEYHWLVGPVRPINAGLKVARGRWIARLDDDDEWTINHLKTLLSYAKLNGSEFISSSYIRKDITGEVIISPSGTPPIGGVQTWLYRSYLRFFKANIHSWRKSWNRNNDIDLQYRFIRAGVRTSCIYEATARVSNRPNQKFVGSKVFKESQQEYERFYALDVSNSSEQDHLDGKQKNI
jgi:glycosyltransferase involved in cell wall biosynthesis